VRLLCENPIAIIERPGDAVWRVRRVTNSRPSPRIDSYHPCETCQAAHALVDASNDPSRGVIVLCSVGAVVLSVGALGSGVAVLNAAAVSPSRRVFPSGPAFRVAVWLLAMGVAVGILLISMAPFDGIAAHGKPLSIVLVDLGAIAASLVCLSGGIIALLNGSRARRYERTWNR
jgi:hypothetical protein